MAKLLSLKEEIELQKQGHLIVCHDGRMRKYFRELTKNGLEHWKHVICEGMDKRQEAECGKVVNQCSCAVSTKPMEGRFSLDGLGAEYLTSETRNYPFDMSIRPKFEKVPIDTCAEYIPLSGETKTTRPV